MRSLIVLLILRGAETAVLELTNSTGSPPSIILGDCKITAIGEGRIRSTCVDERVEALQGELDLIKKALFQPPSLPPSPSSPPPAPSLPPFPLTDAMVYLPFDSSGDGATNKGTGKGTLTGTVAGVGGYAASGHNGGGWENLNGYVSGCSTCGHGTYGTKPFTFALWVKAASSSDTYNYVVDFRGTDKTASYWHLTTGSEHHFGGFAGATGETVVTYDKAAVTGKWVHWAITSDPDAVNNCAFYENGKRVAQLLGPMKVSGAYLGVRNSGELHWNGIVDDVVMFHQVLTAAQIAQIYDDSK